MAKLNAKKTLAAVTLAALTLTTPTIVHANNYSNSNYSYEDCKRADGENQLVGGLLGAVAGGVFGSQVAGNGARTEGSALGAVLGAGIGAAIGDDRRKCGTNNRRAASYDNTQRNQISGYPTSNQGNSNPIVYTSPRIQTVNSRSNYESRRYETSDGYTYNDVRPDNLRRVERKIDRLRLELSELNQRRSYRHDPYVDRRIYEVSCKLAELKKQKKRIKRENLRGERQYRRGNSY